MTDEKNLISLKEASKISGYSSDYIGQLIRAGKIPGKQVYTNISWMTTARAIIEYKNNSERNKGKKDEKGLKAYLRKRKQVFLMELNIFKLFFKTFKTSIPIFLIVIISFLLLAVYIFSSIFSSNSAKLKNINQDKNLEILF